MTNKIRKFQILSRYRANNRVRIMARIMSRILNIVIYYIAMVDIMGLLWLLPWDGYGCYHGMAMVAAMVSIMGLLWLLLWLVP